jgi:hypothetical protein
MKALFLSVLAGAALAAPAASQTFTGAITDSLCANKAGHAQMRMGPTDAECTNACISAHGAAYVLYDGTNVYALSDQKTPAKFAGQQVKVTGTLDAKTKTIRVESIEAGK